MNVQREIGIALNRLAREQLKLRILADLSVDLMVCQLEGIDPLEYVNELREMLDDIADRLEGRFEG